MKHKDQKTRNKKVYKKPVLKFIGSLQEVIQGAGIGNVEQGPQHASHPNKLPFS